MKVLIAGPELVRKNERYMDEKSWSFMQAFGRIGASTEYFSYKPEGLFRFFETDKHLKKLWHVVMNRRLISQVRRFRPDILLISKGGTIEAETLWEIRKDNGTQIINVMNDNPLLMGNVNAIPPCHYYFVKDTYVLQSLRRSGFSNVHYLPQCVDPAVRRPLELGPEDMRTFSSDIMIIGSLYPYRLKLVKELKDLKPAIWGTGWNKADDADILKLYRGRGVWGTEKTKAICGAAITLNPHHPLNDIRGTQSRTFDIAACAGFQLSEYKEDIEDLFEIGREMVCYRTLDELKEQIHYYLLHPDERRKIGTAGRERVLKDHTYDNRLRQILDIMKA